jgi:hypothetical protein
MVSRLPCCYPGDKGARLVALYTPRERPCYIQHEGRNQLFVRGETESLHPGRVEAAHILGMPPSLFLSASVTNKVVTDSTERCRGVACMAGSWNRGAPDSRSSSPNLFT